jgi:CRISPR-associated endonuclease/helicase Cas3
LSIFGHTREGRPPEEWQLLADHLRQVADIAATFAEPFGSAEYARLLGRFHDFGKYSAAFQNMLQAANGEQAHIEGKTRTHVDHSTAGAIVLYEAMAKTSPLLARILAFTIAGHHAGLADFYPSLN